MFLFELLANFVNYPPTPEDDGMGLQGLTLQIMLATYLEYLIDKNVF
jgi:hypothetical protein